MPRFQSFSGFFRHFVLAKLDTSSIRVKSSANLATSYHKISGMQFFSINQANYGKEVGLSGRGLDDRTFALSLRIEINVGAIFFFKILRVHIQQLAKIQTTYYTWKMKTMQHWESLENFSLINFQNFEPTVLDRHF